MLVPTKKIRSNPFRDFEVDPLDEDHIALLSSSVERDGLWHCGAGRPTKDGFIELAYGHTRAEVARRLGMAQVEVFISDFDDESMIRIMGVENSTQRGNSAAAVAGTIAAALRLIAKAIMTGQDIGRILPTSMKAMDTLRGQLASPKGIGKELILQILKDVPRISSYTVQQTLATLKTSGAYKRIIESVAAEVEQREKQRIAELERKEREAAEARLAAQQARMEAERAEVRRKQAVEAQAKKEAEAEATRQRLLAERKERHREEVEKSLRNFDSLRQTRDTTRNAAAAVKDDEATFDFVGVSRYLKSDYQIKAFREAVTSESMRKNLPLNQQAAVAKKLVEMAAELETEVSGTWIKANLTSSLLSFKAHARKLSEAERKALEEEDALAKFRSLETRFMSGVSDIHIAGFQMLKLLEEKHKTVNFVINPSLREGVKRVQEIVNKLAKSI